MEEPRKDPLVGSRIREYEILDVIGKGGMGAVYRARHIYLEQERAIKVIHSNLAEDRHFIDRFIREARILTKLHHPNLVQLHEFGTLDQDVFFMVLELLKGETVFHRMKRAGKLPIREALTITRDAALGLFSAHQQGIVHRDVSPDNLFLARTGSGQEIVKVIDFGVARPNLDAGQPLTKADTFLGKLEYASPEQCGKLEDGQVIDHRTDMYSLGITLYFMLAGRLPFHSPSPQGYIFKHVMEEPKPVSEYVKAIEFPPELDQILLKALAKNREERFATIEEFSQHLDRIATAMGPSSSAPTIDQGVTTAKLELHPGQLFAGRYLIETKLGEGGMGVVYKAVDQMLDVRVALKVMGGHIVHNQLTVDRLKREVILARKVSHHNACRIYDMGESGNTHYLSMEYLEGATLAELIQHRGQLKWMQGISIMKQVLAALHEAHRVGVIHRDLKPQNIMVGPSDTAWIMDFGISTSTEVNKLTATGMIVGTPFYMAPEQLEGKEIDCRADIYACGIILFQMFSGQLPFDARSPLGVIAAHMKSDFPRLTNLIPGFPADLDHVIATALEKDPKARYQTAKELMEALESIDSSKLMQAEATIAIPATAETKGYSKIELAAAPSAAQAPPVPVITQKTAINYKVPALVLTGIILAAAVVWYALRKPEQPPVMPTTVSVPVVINALPWARAKVSPVSGETKITIPAGEEITPCSLLLPAGEYSVVLSNDATSETLTKNIVVKEGESNTFLFTMPEYDPGTISQNLSGFD